MCHCSRHFHVSDVHLKNHPPCKYTSSPTCTNSMELFFILFFFLSRKGRIQDRDCENLMTGQVIHHSGQTTEALCSRKFNQHYCPAQGGFCCKLDAKVFAKLRFFMSLCWQSQAERDREGQRGTGGSQVLLGCI